MGLLESTSPIRFGAFELDANTGELRKAGITVKLHPQPFRVLLLLTQHPGEVVTREQIREQLWGRNTFVDFDHGINFCVNQVRSTLGDNPEKPRYVETLARRGYRFVAPVSVGAASSAQGIDSPISAPPTGQGFAPIAIPTVAAGTMVPPTSAASTQKRKYYVAALCLVIVAAALLGRPWRKER